MSSSLITLILESLQSSTRHILYPAYTLFGISYTGFIAVRCASTGVILYGMGVGILYIAFMDSGGPGNLYPSAHCDHSRNGTTQHTVVSLCGDRAFIALLRNGTAVKACHRAVTELLKNCQRVVKELSKSCQRAVKELSKSCQRVVTELSWSCHRVVTEVL